MEQLNKKKSFKQNSGNLILAILFFISLSLAIWGTNIYRLTIIKPSYLYSVGAFGGLLFNLTLSFLVKTSYSKVWNIFIKFCIGAGISYFGLLYLNQKFADKEVLTDKFKIIRTGTLARGKSGSCLQPFVIINFNGEEKQLVFYCNLENIIEIYSHVTLTYSKGLFGFEVIKSKYLNE